MPQTAWSSEEIPAKRLSVLVLFCILSLITICCWPPWETGHKAGREQKHYFYLVPPGHADFRTCRDTALVPSLRNQEKPPTRSFLWSFAVERGWPLQAEEAPKDRLRGSERCKTPQLLQIFKHSFTFIFLPVLISWSEQKLVWLLHLSCVTQKFGNLTNC